MSTRRVPIVCLPCGKPGTLHGPAVTLKLAPKRPAPLTTGVALNEVAWKDDQGEEVDCTICAYPMSADSEANPWTGPGLFLTQACVNGHVYHKGCLLTHMSRSNSINAATCPECRNPILSEVAASLRRNGAPAPVGARELSRPYLHGARRPTDTSCNFVHNLFGHRGALVAVCMCARGWMAARALVLNTQAKKKSAISLLVRGELIRHGTTGTEVA